MALSVESQIKDLLRNRNVETGTWKLFVGKLPAEPDTAIAVMKSSGPGGQPSLLVDFPGIQILLRGARGGDSYEDAEAKLRQIRDNLLGIPSKPSEMPTLISCTERGSSVPLGYDEMERPLFSNNFQLIVEPVPSPYTHREPL